MREQLKRSARPDDSHRGQGEGQAKSKGQAGQGADGKPRPEEARVARWEWLVAGIGALFVLAVLGYLAWYRITHPDTPPKLVAEVASVSEDAGFYYVAVTARNDGRATAAAAILRGELMADGRIVEESEAEIDYLPGHSRRQLTLIFTEDPAAHGLVLRFKGYSRP